MGRYAGLSTMSYLDWAGKELTVGDLVLDSAGRYWRVDNFAYGRESVALCTGAGYNRQPQRAVRLGQCFRVETLLANNRKDGERLFHAIYEEQVGAEERRKISERRAYVQSLSSRPKEPL